MTGADAVRAMIRVVELTDAFTAGEYELEAYLDQVAEICEEFKEDM
jgi:hypothetical protein